MSWVGIFMLAIVLITSALLLLGSFPAHNRYLKAGFALAIGTVFTYAGIVSYAVATACQSTTNCISGPFGSQTTTNGTLSWGFHSGFYLFLVGAFLTLGAIVSHRVFVREQAATEVHASPHAISSPTVKACSSCGKNIPEDAKFCLNCGVSMTKTPATSTPPSTPAPNS
ncbi:MAG TPA: zinc ribbon domain-containing protein [Candidatus Bathyarchaeia archaeon]|nr:zinc ribbon domain-containing protein [Candidatus Bathyarchaeia archaeon]